MNTSVNKWHQSRVCRVFIFPFVFIQLGQKQKELDQLQKENNILKEKLQDALGREQNAREGYILQVLHST